MAKENADNSLPLFTVDAFASKPFTGNPAAVCLLQNEVSELRRPKK